MRFQYSDQADRIIETVRREILYVGDLFSNSELNQKVISKLVQLKLTLELDDVPESIEDKLSFGYQIVMFGRWEFQTKEPHDSELEETDRLHKVLYKSDSHYIADARVLRIDFDVPIHRRWGTTFKLFVDVYELSLINAAKKLLADNGLEDIGQSGSGEKQRIGPSICGRLGGNRIAGLAAVLDVKLYGFTDVAKRFGAVVPLADASGQRRHAGDVAAIFFLFHV